MNGAVHVHSHIMREIVSSAAEAKLGGLFHNSKEAVPMRITLEELGHPQPPTTIITDNSTATGIANDTVKQKRSKAMDMRYYWVRDRVRQEQFHVVWRKGKTNKGDYFSKHHPASHHQVVRPAYLYDPNNPARNYFECLQDQDDADKLSSSSRIRDSNTPGEGVLVYEGNPDVTSHPGYPRHSIPAFMR